MDEAQTKWLNENPKFSTWRSHGAVSIYGWEDVGYLTPDGRFIPDGQTHGWAFEDVLLAVPNPRVYE